MGKSQVVASVTPILDLDSPLPRSFEKGLTWRDVVILLVFTFGAALFVYFTVQIPVISRIAARVNIIFNQQIGLNSSTDIYMPVKVAALFAFMVFPVAAIHEFGHLAAGLLAKLRFKILVVAPFSLTNSESGLKVQVHRNLPVSGYVHMDFDRRVRMRKRYLLFTAGGPLANLISGFLALFVLETGIIDPTSLWHKALAMFSAYSLFTGISNLFPFQTSLAASDGVTLYMLSRSPAKTRSWLAVFALNRLLERHVPVKSWNKKWAEWAGCNKDKSGLAFRGNWLGLHAGKRSGRERRGCVASRKMP
ncbi:MAG: family metallopeptidase [Acidobacteriales bacterium]|nr:family metallopeptidase [Terriglobales bacterium]